MGVLGFTLLSVMSLCWFFLTSSGSNVRLMMADTLITTQHREWAKYLIGSTELQKRVEAYWEQFDKWAMRKIKDSLKLIIAPPSPQQLPRRFDTIEPISGAKFRKGSSSRFRIRKSFEVPYLRKRVKERRFPLWSKDRSDARC